MRQVHQRPGRHTWSELIALPDGDRRELIDGHLVELEVPGKLHEWAVLYLGQHLVPWAMAHGFRAAGSGYRVRVSERRGVMPDLQLYPEEDFDKPENDAGYVSGHPYLVVEILSPSSRSYDRVTKLSYYASIQVEEYWIVDPDARRIERYALKPSGYVLEQQVGEDEVFRPSRMRGVKIPLAPLWATRSKKKR